MSVPALFVLGMHRSGTSAFAGVAHHLGVELGSDLWSGDKANAFGYFEHAPITLVHERLLEAIGHHWYDPTAMPRGWLEGRPSRDAAKELSSLVRQTFAESRFWGIKDPRLCLLMPLWQRLLSGSNSDIRCVIACRNPIEVADSLKARDSIHRGHALALWLRYTSSSIRDTIGLKRSVVVYEDLLRDWSGTVRRIAEQLEIDWPRNPSAARGDIDRFLDAELRRQKVGRSQLDRGDPFESRVALLYDALSAGVEAPEGLDTNAAPILTDLDRADWFCSALREVVGGTLALRASLAETNERVAEMLNSKSWRYTEPIRAIEQVPSLRVLLWRLRKRVQLELKSRNRD